MNDTKSIPYSPERPLRLGGRGSKMALAQAELAAAAITAVYPQLGAAGAIEYVVIKTSGDATQIHGDIPLAAFGSKELWTKEVETALLNGRIDIGVHCVKDVQSDLAAQFALPVVLPRDDPRDAWICGSGHTLATLPAGSVVGTSSPRRQGIILSQRPDLKIVPFRGNADTRLEKLRQGQVNATLLAHAGLVRIGRTETITADLSVDEMLPACGQGALCFETLSADTALTVFLAPVNHTLSHASIMAERALLQNLGGDCHTPIAAYADIDGETLTLRGLVVRPDGTGLTSATESGPMTDPVAIGNRLGDTLRQNAPLDIFPTHSRHTA